MSSSSSSPSYSSSNTASGKKGALIFLHGLGDSPAGWSSLEWSLPQINPRLKDIEYVFPPAPTIPISINGGMRMPGWFDLYDWPIGVGVKEDRKGKLQAVSQIEQAVLELEQTKGIPRNRIVVGGFSQGGAIALLAAYHQNSNNSQTPFAGCAVLSGWLTLESEIKPNDATPLFWAHGQYDDKVLFEQQAYGVDKLRSLGVKNIQAEQYPMGHESHPKEMVALAAFLDTVLFQTTTSTTATNKQDEADL